jgi:hypothetical protein
VSLFTREQFAKPDDDAGVFIDGLGRALVTWTAMQDRSVTLHEAAKAFNTTAEVIAEAIEDAAWISVNGDTLELDGE